MFKDIKKNAQTSYPNRSNIQTWEMPEFVDTQILKRQLRLKAGHLYIQDYKKIQFENSLIFQTVYHQLKWRWFKIISSSNSSTFEKFENFLEENKFIKIDDLV